MVISYFANSFATLSCRKQK